MLSPPSPVNLIKVTHPCNNHLSDCLRRKDMQKNRDIKVTKDILTFGGLELTLFNKTDLGRPFHIVIFLRTYAHAYNTPHYWLINKASPDRFLSCWGA